MCAFEITQHDREAYQQSTKYLVHCRVSAHTTGEALCYAFSLADSGMKHAGPVLLSQVQHRLRPPPLLRILQLPLRPQPNVSFLREQLHSETLCNESIKSTETIVVRTAG